MHILICINEKYEMKAKTGGFEMKLDEFNKIIKFSCFSSLLDEISDAIHSYQTEPFELMYELSIIDEFGVLKALNNNQILEKIYEKMMDIFKDFRKLFRFFMEKLVEMNETDKNCKICDSAEFFTFKRNSSIISIRTKVVYKSKVASLDLEKKKLLL